MFAFTNISSHFVISFRTVCWQCAEWLDLCFRPVYYRTFRTFLFAFRIQTQATIPANGSKSHHWEESTYINANVYENIYAQPL